jgi:hypothetical protein
VRRQRCSFATRAGRNELALSEDRQQVAYPVGILRPNYFCVHRGNSLHQNAAR